MKQQPELLLPAGDLERMRTAFDFGADAVYAGQPRYSLRARNNAFQLDELAQGIQEAHRRDKCFYVTSNLLPHNSKVHTYMKDIEPVIEIKPDAMIMADPGLIMMVKERWPDIPVHLSVQANTVNFMSVKFWQKIGISRIILSRELSLHEIAEIREACPDIELEVFVHGALCIAYSGRCLLSGYFNHRDPNQGTCTNACRWEYNVYAGKKSPDTQTEQDFLLEETNRPGAFMPITEDEHGTYIMNSKDLRGIELTAQLIDIGVDSLKIEGRTKSIYYVARVTQSYRQAIDDAVMGKPFDITLLANLEGLANRGYTSGFLERHQSQDYQNYLSGHSESKRSQYVGLVLEVDEQGLALIEVKNHFALGDKIEIIHPSGNETIILSHLQTTHGYNIEEAKGNGIQVKMPGMQGKEGALLARVMNNQ